MIDFHTHILPNIDDGCKTISQSVEALSIMKKSGVDVVIATSHYYRSVETIDEFIQRRNQSYKILMEECTQTKAKIPHIILGSEVEYYGGISKNDDLDKLCIDGTGYMLLEMPFVKWDSLILTEVRKISANQGIIPIIAHGDRYIKYKNKISKLNDLQVPIQINASAFIDPGTSRKYLKLLKTGKVHLVGSDCHNLDDRKPNIDLAYKIIQKQLGEGQVEKINNLGYRIINLARGLKND